MKSVKTVVAMAPASRKGTSISDSVEQILRVLGEDVTREGLQRTPERAEKAYRFLTSGYDANVEEIVNGAIFHEKCDEMVVVKDIEFFSLCEHHMLPFYGKVHVAYLPNHEGDRAEQDPAHCRHVRAASADAGAADAADRRDASRKRCIRAGVGVIFEARHFCMMMRGVEKQHSGTVTSAMMGGLRTRKDTRDEFLSLIRHNSLQA